MGLPITAECKFPKPQVTFHGDVEITATISRADHDKLMQLVEAQNYGKRNNKVIYKLVVTPDDDPCKEITFSNLIPYPEYQS